MEASLWAKEFRFLPWDLEFKERAEECSVSLRENDWVWLSEGTLNKFRREDAGLAELTRHQPAMCHLNVRKITVLGLVWSSKVLHTCRHVWISTTTESIYKVSTSSCSQNVENSRARIKQETVWILKIYSAVPGIMNLQDLIFTHTKDFRSSRWDRLLNTLRSPLINAEGNSDRINHWFIYSPAFMHVLYSLLSRLSRCSRFAVVASVK